MKKGTFLKALQHLSISLSLVMITLLILNYYNPMLGFLSSWYSQAVMAMLALTALVSGICGIVMIGRLNEKNKKLRKQLKALRMETEYED